MNFDWTWPICFRLNPSWVNPPHCSVHYRNTSKHSKTSVEQAAVVDTDEAGDHDGAGADPIEEIDTTEHDDENSASSSEVASADSALDNTGAWKAAEIACLIATSTSHPSGADRNQSGRGSELVLLQEEDRP